ncbi:hypothetical protein P152DRAFT_370358, partial [Eremomyces bilateralis CBS 781.70]
YMGPRSVSNIYAAELRGIQLALDIADQHSGIKRRTVALTPQRRIPLPSETTHIYIFADSQGAPKALLSPQTHSGQYYVLDILYRLQLFKSAGYAVHLYWIPSYCGILGNEQAN